MRFPIDLLKSVTFTESHMDTDHEKEYCGVGLAPIHESHPKSTETHFGIILVVVRVLLVFTVTFSNRWSHTSVKFLLS